MCMPLVGKRMEEQPTTLLPTEEFITWELVAAGREVSPFFFFIQKNMLA